MAVQETTFVTLGQRALQWPLGVRMHYGHPDFFDKLWTCTRGGISKASKDTNLNEDIFAGFNHTLRGGRVQYAEYTQVGKGRDVGLMQITIFEKKLAQARRCPPRLRRALLRPGPPLPHLHRDWARPSHICTGTGLRARVPTGCTSARQLELSAVERAASLSPCRCGPCYNDPPPAPPLPPFIPCAQGAGEQVISRDIHRLTNSFDFWRLQGFYYGGVGFYMSTYLTVMAIYIYV